MALVDKAHSSQYGPNNPGSVGTGFTTGPNVSPLANMLFGNPGIGGGVYNSLLDASHASMYGPTNTIGQPGTGFIPDPYGNIPSELPQ